MPDVVDALIRLLGVPRWIARPALRAALWHVVFVGAVTIIKSATNALYLARADSTRLPLLYVAVAIVVAISTSGLARLLAHRPPARVLTVGISAIAAALLLATAAVALSVPGSAAALYVVGEAAATSGSVLFWARVMDAFSSRDQKRVVGVVGAGGMLGAALGGGLISAIASTTGVLVPLALSSVAFVAALPLLRGLRSRSQQRAPAERGRLTTALSYLLGSAYPLAVAALVVLLAATGAATDFVFRLGAAEARSEAEMAGLFGMLNAVVGICVVFVQLSLTGRLLARIGVFAFIGIVPALLVATGLLHTVWPSFAVLVVMKGIEMAGAFSLNQAGVALLYNPMPGAVQGALRTLIDGAVKKTGAAMAGLVLAGIAALAGSLVGSGLVVALSAATLVLLPVLRRHYLRALDDKLRADQLAPRSQRSRIDPSDAVTRNALRKGLDDSDPDRVVSALEALGESYVLTPDEVARLIEHKDEHVRTAALSRVPADPTLVDRLLLVARSEHARRPRAEAVRALARVDAQNAAALTTSFLDDDEPGVVCAAIEVGLKVEAPAARQKLDALTAQLSTRTPAWRREVARLFGRLDDTADVIRRARYDAALSQLIDDEEPSVRALAIEAAGRERHAAHEPLLIDHLGDRALRACAADALVQYADQVVPALSKALDDLSLPVAVRIHVPRVLERIGTVDAARALLFSNPKDDAYLQERIAACLVNIVAKAEARDVVIDVDRERCDAAIGRRLVAYSAYTEARIDLDASDDARLSLLRRLVDDRATQNLRIAFDLLGIHRGLSRMRAVFRGLTLSDEGARADALELLDTTLSGDDLRADFLSLLEARRRSATPEQEQARARALCASKDPLLRAVAKATLRRLGIMHQSAPPGAASAVGPGAFELEGSDMAEDLVERLFLLEHVDLFDGLGADDLMAIATLASEQTVAAGAWLYREGEQGSNLYVIVAGDVELTREGRPVMTLHAGESAGQVSFLDRGPRPVSARVSDRGAARVLVIERDAFLDLMADRPSLMHTFFGVLAQRLRALIVREEAPRAGPGPG